MRRRLCIAAILMGVASASAAEPTYKACALDGMLGIFSFTKFHDLAGEFVEISVVGSGLEPVRRPADSVLFFEAFGEVFVFGNEKATRIQGDKLTQIDCYPFPDFQLEALLADAARQEFDQQRALHNEEVAELKRQIAEAKKLDQQRTLLNEEVVDLRRQIAEFVQQRAHHNEEVVKLRRQIAEAKETINRLSIELDAARVLIGLKP